MTSDTDHAGQLLRYLKLVINFENWGKESLNVQIKFRSFPESVLKGS